MKVAFMGTPEFAVPSLEALLRSEHEVVVVVTGADKPAGRSLKITETPVKEKAKMYGLPILQPVEFQDPFFYRALAGFHPDINMVVAFRILPPVIFNLPPKGSVNLHASLLPCLRGAAPVNWALMRGHNKTGVTTFLIEQKVDTGNLLLQKQVDILPDDDSGTLAGRLAEAGAMLVVETLDGIARGTLEPNPQVGTVTTAPRITREICQIDWNREAEEIHNQVRGLSPNPGAFCVVNGKVLKIYKTAVLSAWGVSRPSAVVQASGERLIIGTGSDYLEILELQIEGKRRMPAAQFLRGNSFKPGTKLSG